MENGREGKGPENTGNRRHPNNHYGQPSSPEEWTWQCMDNLVRHMSCSAIRMTINQPNHLNEIYSAMPEKSLSVVRDPMRLFLINSQYLLQTLDKAVHGPKWDWRSIGAVFRQTPETDSAKPIREIRVRHAGLGLAFYRFDYMQDSPRNTQQEPPSQYSITMLGKSTLAIPIRVGQDPNRERLAFNSIATKIVPNYTATDSKTETIDMHDMTISVQVPKKHEWQIFGLRTYRSSLEPTGLNIPTTTVMYVNGIASTNVNAQEQFNLSKANGLASLLDYGITVLGNKFQEIKMCK